MTRGQDSLGMDLHVDLPAEGGSGQSALAEIIVLPPSPEEIAAHQEMLQALNKESKGACLWLQDSH
jgi:DNA polymerase-3 subunit epsilon